MARSRSMLSALAALWAVAVILPASVAATYPGVNGRIAFSNDVNGPAHVYSVQPNGTGLEQLTHGPFSAYSPAWSADGSRITYQRYVPDGKFQIYSMNADGGDPNRVTHEHRSDHDPAFSPNGHRIVYTRWPAPPDYKGNVRIASIRRDGSDLQILAPGEEPEYSPDGRWIAYRAGGIWLMHPNGTAVHRVTKPPEGFFDAEPSWRPDGERIIFKRCEPLGIYTCVGGSIYGVRPDGSGLKQVPESWTGYPDRAVYSPDARRIAMTRGDDDCSDIATISPFGTNYRPVTNQCDDPSSFDLATDPSWQPLPNG